MSILIIGTQICSLPSPGPHSHPSCVLKEWAFHKDRLTCDVDITLHALCGCAKLFSHAQLFATLWTVAYQAPLSMEFFRQEYWSGLPCPPAGDCLDPGIQPTSPWSLHCRWILSHWAISTCYPGMQWGEFTSGGICLIYLGFGNQGHIFLRKLGHG